MLAPGLHTLDANIYVHFMDAARPRPTAIFQAGIHGDEIAGVHALEELLEARLAPTNGRLIVIPVMNPPAYRNRTRAAPGGLDLNRCFPGDPNGEQRETRLAHAFMEMIRGESPDLLVTLHESNKRYDPEVRPSFGQTIVYGVDVMPQIVGRVVDRLNEEVADASEHWAPLHYPVATSSTEVLVDAIGCVGLCIETWMGFGLERRTQMQRRVVELLLADVGVVVQ